MQRSARIVHRDLGQGLYSLANVASIAPFIGILGTLIGIVNSFKGIAGEKSAILAARASDLSDACVPTALGLLVAIPAHWCYKYLSARLECFDREMENAALQLANLLVAFPVRSMPADPAVLVFRDDTGHELQESQGHWYWPRLAVIGLLLAAWIVHVARYFDQEALTLVPAMRWAAWYLLFSLAVSWFVAYPIWVKVFRRALGALAALASLICLAWSVAELVLGSHLW